LAEPVTRTFDPLPSPPSTT